MLRRPPSVLPAFLGFLLFFISGLTAQAQVPSDAAGKTLVAGWAFKDAYTPPYLVTVDLSGVIDSMESMHTDFGRGDRSVFTASEIDAGLWTPNGRAYVDGTHFSHNWERGQSALEGGGDPDTLPSSAMAAAIVDGQSTSENRTILTARRYTPGDLNLGHTFDDADQYLPEGYTGWDRSLRFNPSSSVNRVSLVFNSTGVEGLQLTFAALNFLGASSVTSQIKVHVASDANGGSLTENVALLTVTGVGPTDPWQTYTVDLSGYPELNDNPAAAIVLEFVAPDCDVLIDNVQIVAGFEFTTPVPPTLALASSGAPPAASKGVTYSAYSFVRAGLPLPTVRVAPSIAYPTTSDQLTAAGFALSSTGVLTVPNSSLLVGGEYKLRVEAFQSSTGDTSAPLEMTLVVNAPTELTPEASTQPAGTKGASNYEFTYALGGYPTPKVTVVPAASLPAGATAGLPPGLAIVRSGTTARITIDPSGPGTITASGRYVGVVRAYRDLDNDDVQDVGETDDVDSAFDITITEPPTITLATGPGSLTYTTGVVSSTLPRFEVTAFPAATISLVGTLPPGMDRQITSSSLTLTGYPTTRGVRTLSVQATQNLSGVSPAVYEFTLTALQAAAWATVSTSEEFLEGVAKSFAVTATGTPTPTVAVSGAPSWLGTSTATNALTGTTTVTLSGTAPSGATGFTLLLSAQNSGGQAGSRSIGISVTRADRAPAITTQPAPLSVVVGGAATFTVIADGEPAPTYQWRRNGVALAGATQASLQLTGIQSTSAGDYDVVVTNSISSVTSDAATLTVIAPVSITTSPASQTIVSGQPVTFTVAATGTGPLTYQWRKNGTDIVGATGSSYAIGAVNTASAGAYTVVVTNAAGPVTSDAAVLTVTVPATITPPASLIFDRDVAVPAGTTFVIGGNPAPEVTFAGDLPPGVTREGMTLTGTPGARGVFTGTVTATNTVGGVPQVATYNYTITVREPASFLSVPDQASVIVGTSSTLVVTAAGVPAPEIQVTGAPGWLLANESRDETTGTTTLSLTGTPPSGATAFTLQIEAVNSPGGSSGVENLPVSVELTPVAPVITTQPLPVTVVAGGVGTLTVVASGVPVPQYQWRFGGQPIAGAIAASLQVVNVTSADVGSYDVVVTNGSGSVTSNAVVLAVLGPAQVITDPISLTVVAGRPASFSVTASGTEPLSYQWSKNGTPIPGATAATLTFATATVADAGDYRVVVNNAIGSSTSATATLVVGLPPAITLPPLVFTVGQTPSPAPTFSVTGDPTPTVTISGVPPSTGFSVNGATLQGTPIVRGVFTGSVRAANQIAGEAFETNAAFTLTVQEAPAFVTLPTAASWRVGEDRTVTLVASGVPAPDFAFVGAPAWLTSSTSKNEIIGTTTVELHGVPPSGANGFTLQVTATSLLGSTTPAEIMFTVAEADRAPVITTQPAAVTAIVGTSATFTTVADGVPVPTYQWRRAGQAISGATNASFTLAAVTSTDAAAYDVVVTNVAGSVTSAAATLTVIEPATIVTEPTSQLVAVNSTATFTVAAAGTAPLTYQWEKAGAPIAGATASALSLPSVTTTDAGVYRVVVTNAGGSATSAEATLQVAALPVITTAPAGTSLAAGARLTLRVVAEGLGTLSYQWRLDGTPLEGATAATYSVGAITPEQAGNYDVVVTNLAGETTSAVAPVVVASSPVIVTAPAGVIAAAGGSASFAVAAEGIGLTYQWYRGAALINGATSSALTLADLTTDDASAPYTVQVTNLAGATMSEPAWLIVVDPAASDVGPDAATFDLTVAAALEAGEWTVTTEADWLTVEPAFDGETSRAVVTVQASDEGTVRTGDLVFLYGESVLIHPVTQAEFLVFDDSSFGFIDIEDRPEASARESSGPVRVAAADAPLWYAFGMPRPVVRDLLAGHATVLEPGGDATGLSGLVSAAPLPASGELRVRGEVRLLAGGATAGARATLALTAEASALPDGAGTTGDLGAGASFTLAQTGEGRAGALHTLLRYRAEDGTEVALDHRHTLPRGELSGQWVQVEIAIASDRTISFWLDAAPFGDPIRIWAPSPKAHPALLAGQRLVLSGVSSGTDRTAYLDNVLAWSDVATRAATATIENLSARAFVGTGERVVIGGVNTDGRPVELIVRGLGPTLRPLGLTDAIPAPRLAFFDGSSPARYLRVQGAWQAYPTEQQWLDLAARFAAVGASPLADGALDSAWFVNTSNTARLRTIHLRDVNDATGEGMIEIFRDPTSNLPGRLTNLSTRAFVPAGRTVIPGWIVSGNSARLFLVRALGPALQAGGVTGFMAKPTITLYRGSEAIASNTGWSAASNAAAISAKGQTVGAGALPAGSADSAMLLLLDPGLYSAVVRSADGSGEGVVLVELYDAGVN